MVKKIKTEKSIFIIQNNNVNKVIEAIEEINNLSDSNKKIIAKKSITYASKYKWEMIAQKEWDRIRELARS